MNPLAVFGNSKESSNTNLSRSSSLSIIGTNGKEISLTNLGNQIIEIRIPRDPTLLLPEMSLENVTSLNTTATRLVFNLHYVNITQTHSSSIHLQMQPLNESLAYLMIYKFDQSPVLNSSMKVIDGWSLFCPLSNIFDYH